MADINCKISVEKTIHDSIRLFLQHLSDSMQIQVKSISIDWMDVSSVSDEKHIATSIDIRTNSVSCGKSE